ncbi:MAG: hypothetical protein EOM61_10885 [Bacteroidia bacterium]|nr:hypothetical protein [Bacteroidia bacterium]
MENYFKIKKYGDYDIFILNEGPEITPEIITMQLGYLISDPSTPKDLRLMVVAKDSIPMFDIDDKEVMQNVIDAVLKNFNTFRQAFVVKSPKNTAFTMAYKNRISEPRYQVQIFYTEEAAIEWLAGK